ncbi:hypothetical protein AQUCO_00300029v1 [Aquilegia coerulea]|uniref:Cyclin-dependent protein kinase inhibitor SMR3 n=1 Tax=Aquilegia coerulea TaxID=218851 RepID=A0A2G5EX55_AQUCA|nr:hypothetical protein AQUCO_00300029v1 [Aquilegia coerulea]
MKDHLESIDELEIVVTRRPTLEFEDRCIERIDVTNYRQADEKKNEKKQPQEEEYKSTVSTMEVRIPSLGDQDFKVHDEDDDGFRTPTSMDHRIPVIRQCPPAPRKPKSCPMKKRKASSNLHRIKIDLSKEIELMFPSLVSDLDQKIIKKLRGNSTTT